MSSAPRVLVVDENLPLPFDPRVWLECRALADAGYDVTALCPRGSAAASSGAYEFLDGVHIHRFAVVDADGAGTLGYAREYATALWATFRFALRHGMRRPFDVIHLCNPPDLMILSVLPQRLLRGSKVIFDQHDLVPELWVSKFGDDHRTLYRVQCAAEAFTYRLANHVISTNESYRQVALDRGGKRPEDVTVVRSAPDVGRVRRVAPDEAWKRGRRHLAVYVGVMGHQDGVDHAVRALAAYRNLGRDDLQAVFVGTGEGLEPARALAEELDLTDRVEFTGFVEDPADLMTILSTADVGLSPDPLNPLNDVSTMNKILEYMALGIPIVSFDLREARVSAGDAAIYARPNDERQFAECIAELVDDEPRRRRMAELGRERIEGDLSWEVSRSNLLAAYAATLEGRAPTTG